ncbi:unnamed protein product, partial [Rotaria socialis]
MASNSPQDKRPSTPVLTEHTSKLVSPVTLDEESSLPLESLQESGAHGYITAERSSSPPALLQSAS